MACLSALSVLASARTFDPVVNASHGVGSYDLEHDYSETLYGFMEISYRKGGLFSNAKVTCSIPEYPTFYNHIYVDITCTDQEYFWDEDEVCGGAASASITGSTDVAAAVSHFSEVWEKGNDSFCLYWVDEYRQVNPLSSYGGEDDNFDD